MRKETTSTLFETFKETEPYANSRKLKSNLIYTTEVVKIWGIGTWAVLEKEK